jgi:thiol-disulfide isomerase/thioredoxin
MKQFAFFLLFLIATREAHSQPATPFDFTIKAFLPTWKGGTAQLIRDGATISTTVIEGDMLSISGRAASGGPASILLRKNRSQLYVPLFLEPGLIRIRTQSRYRLVPYGTPLNDQYAAFRAGSDSILRTQPAATFAASRAAEQAVAATFIRNNPSSPISLRLLTELYALDRSAPDSIYHSLYEALDSSLKQSPMGQVIGAEAETRFRTSVGHPAPQLRLPHANNVTDDVIGTGHITLLYFWASWCAPCRRELPALRKLEADFGGLVLTGVSLDTDSAAWAKALRLDRRGGAQFLDRRGFTGVSARTYGVSSIPTSFLIDESGRIRGRDLTPEAIALWLHQHEKAQ